MRKESTQFQPGVSGNPNGRPRGATTKQTQWVKLLEAHAPELINKCVELALKGNEACLRLAIDKLLPRAKDQPVTITLPSGKISPESIEELSDDILRQLESGKITPEQARSLFEVIKAYRNVIPEMNSKALSLLETLINDNKL